MIAQLQALGPVEYVIAPNKSHHLFLLDFMGAFPTAKAWVAPGLHDKRPDLLGHPSLAGREDLWEPELQGFFIDGLPLINETVWFHPATGTLILTDLLFFFGSETRGFSRLLARLLGVYNHLGMSRTMKLLVKDKAALARSVRPLLDLPVQRIIVAHGQVVEKDARQALARAFAWLF